MPKILFIEDEAALQKTVGDSLIRLGWQVISALDGEIGLRLVYQEKPDLILLDLVLPRIHGIDVLKKIKGDETIQKIPVVILTNNEDVKSVQEALELGATTYLIKANYELPQLLDKIKSFLPENKKEDEANDH